MMKGLLMVLTMVLTMVLYGCAGSTYEYTKGDAHVLVKSKNEIEQMRMYINRETGELEVDIGGMTKSSDVEAIGDIVKTVTDAVKPVTALIDK